MRTTALLLLAVASIALAGDPPAPEPRPPHGAERDALFSWMDGLGFPGTADGPLVRVTFWAGTEPGFLASDDPKAPRVTTIQLFDLDAVPVPPDAPNWKRVTFERIDGTVAAKDLLA
jgi:hypothetical protein